MGSTQGKGPANTVEEYKWELYFGDMQTVAQRIAASTAGILYGGVLITFVALIKRDLGSGHWVILVLLVCWVSDTTAYFVGRLLGKTKLYPAVSPGKTRAGAVGGLLIRENCQWPYTLPAFGELHPEALDESPTHFSMRLSPASSGVQMLGDSLPHALSLLQSLAPGDDASVESPRFSRASSSAASLRVEFSYRTSGAAVAAEVDLIPSDAFPRPAGYGVNGRWAERKVDAADYSIAFAAGGREVPVQDPLGLRIEAFVRELESARHAGTGSQALGIVQRMELLESLVLAWERDFGD